MNYIDIIKNGIVKENPTFVLMLGMCPTLATTTSALNGMSMGLATMAVLICTNFVISCLKSATPDKVRIPVFIVVIAAFVTVLQLAIKAYLPDIAWRHSSTASASDWASPSDSPCWAFVANCWAQAPFSASCCCLRPTTFCSLCCLRVLSSCWDSSSRSLTN